MTAIVVTGPARWVRITLARTADGSGYEITPKLYLPSLEGCAVVLDLGDPAANDHRGPLPSVLYVLAIKATRAATAVHVARGSKGMRRQVVPVIRAAVICGVQVTSDSPRDCPDRLSDRKAARARRNGYNRHSEGG